MTLHILAFPTLCGYSAGKTTVKDCRMFRHGLVGCHQPPKFTNPLTQSRNAQLLIMAPVFFPITENATIQHVLQISQKETQDVRQSYTIVTFDLGVAQKAYSIIWQNHVRFGNVIIRIGVFHTVCSLFRALGKHMQGSGFEV